MFTFCRKLRERREAMPPVGTRLSADDDDGDDGAGVDRGGGRAALATFTLARCRISSTYQTERQASGYNMRLIDE